MGIVGIVAEYNPFHNGHAYQIKQARKITGCESLIVAMSGDFVQRGTPAFMDKELRTIAALQAGADMVLQISTPYSTASAESFAYGSVALLSAAGIDTLVFGCENHCIHLLENLAGLYLNEPEEYKQRLLSYLKDGMSFPVARSKATVEYFSDMGVQKDDIPKTDLQTSPEEIENILKQPNNILAIEYIKALKRLEKEGRLIKEISLCPILRIGTGYHSMDTADHICSATALREMFFANTDSEWKHFVPEQVALLMDEYFKKNAPVTEDDFSNELRYRLIAAKKTGYAHYADSNEDISNRLINCLKDFTSYTDFCKQMQTKDITYARISRILLHILLDITEEKMQFLKNTPVPFIRVLGFKKERMDLLSHIAELKIAPLLVNTKNSNELLSEEALSIFETDAFARELYLTKIEGKSDYQFPVRETIK